MRSITKEEKLSHPPEPKGRPQTFKYGPPGEDKECRKCGTIVHNQVRDCPNCGAHEDRPVS